MTFLNPLLLFGLAAAAIPVLLHLFNLRKLKKIDFSTLTFLKELQKTKIRRLKLRQLLLLLLRTLLIIIIVCAFARPTLRSIEVGDPNAHAKTTAVLIIDNSYTMTSVDQDGELLKQALDKARKILDLMKDGDDVFLVPMSDVGNPQPEFAASALRDFAVVRSKIRTISPSYVHKTIEDALRYSAGLLSMSKNLNKEVYVFSDFKIGNLQAGRGQNRVEDIFHLM